MTRQTRRLLDERIEKEIELLDTLSPNDPGYQAATNRLEMLIKARYDTVDNGVSKWLKMGVEIVGIGSLLAFYGIWTVSYTHLPDKFAAIYFSFLALGAHNQCRLAVSYTHLRR